MTNHANQSYIVNIAMEKIEIINNTIPLYINKGLVD